MTTLTIDRRAKRYCLGCPHADDPEHNRLLPPVRLVREGGKVVGDIRKRTRSGVTRPFYSTWAVQPNPEPGLALRFCGEFYTEQEAVAAIEAARRVA